MPTATTVINCYATMLLRPFSTHSVTSSFFLYYVFVYCRECTSSAVTLSLWDAKPIVTTMTKLMMTKMLTKMLTEQSFQHVGRMIQILQTWMRELWKPAVKKTFCSNRKSYNPHDFFTKGKKVKMKVQGLI